jgi:hypothetical protein
MVSHAPGPNEIAYLQKITSPGGTEISLVQGSGPVAAHEVKADAPDDAFGTWGSHVDLTLTNEEGTIYHDIVDTTFDAGHAVSGTMLFNETLGGDVDSSNSFGSVTIYDGVTLTLNEGDYYGGLLYVDGGALDLNGGHLADFTIMANDDGTITASGATRFDDMQVSVQSSGSINCDDDLVVISSEFNFYGDQVDMGNALGFSSCEFHYYTPPGETCAELHREAGTLFLEPGSEGASMEGTNFNITILQGNVTFDMENITLRIGCDAAIYGLKNSAIIIGDSSYWPLTPVTNTIHLEGMSLSSLSMTAAQYADVTDCEILSNTYICGGSPELTLNAFVGPVNVIYGGTPVLQENVFHDSLTLISPPFGSLPGTPTIQDNNFMGPNGILYDVGISTNPPPAPGSIVIDANYYGSPNGPSLGYTNTTHYGFLGDNGAQFGANNRTNTTPQYEWFSIPAYHTEPGTPTPLKEGSPHIWKAGWAVGQGILNWIPTLSAPMYKGVPGMVAFDVRSSEECTANCYLQNLSEGTTLRPLYAPKPLHRSIMPERKSRVRSGWNNLLFEVPSPNVGNSVHFQLHAIDETGADHMLQDGFLNFTNHPWVRPLKIAVVPIDMRFWRSRLSAPAGGVMSSFIQQTLPAIFPIPNGKLEVDIKPKSIIYTSVGIVSSLPGLGAMAAKLSKKYINTSTNAYDLVVALMPKGAIRRLSAEINNYITKSPPAAGVNFSYGKYFWMSTSRILIVDSSQPMAYLHELGHAAGLYRDTEQYDMPEYKKTEGKPLTHFSAAPVKDPGLTWFPRSRIAHFAPTNASWYDKDYSWIDVMGLCERQTWPDIGTHKDIMEFLDAICSTTAVRATTLTGDSASQDSASRVDSALTENIRASDFASGNAVVIGGLSVRIDESVGQQPIPECAWIFDAAGMEETPEEIVNGGNWYQHAILRFFNASATIISNVTFDLPSTQLDSSWWSYYTAMPANCTRIQLLWEKNGETRIQDWASAGTLTVQIDETQLTDPLAREANLEWTITASDPATNSHLYTLVSYSLDDGATWEDLDEPTEDDFLAFNTDFLPISGSIAFRVTVSDGFSMAQDTVTGLRIVNRTPTVEITSPRTGDVAREGTEWPLVATAIDLEDGNLSVTWNSSRDGPVTTNTILSTGSHTLTASATDSSGNSTSDTVQVQVVLTPTDTDLAIDSLEPAGSTIDMSQNWSLLQPGMTKGETNWIECIIRNSGILTTGTLDAVVYLPSGATQSIPSQSLVLAAFESVRILLPIDTTEYGVYRVEAHITPEGNPDRTPTNNQATCGTYTKSPALMIQEYVGYREEQITVPLAYSVPGETASAYPLVYNGGNAPLSITSMTLSNHTVSVPPSLKIYNVSPALPAVLPPGSNLSFVVEYYAVEEGIKEATLHIVSDDPLRPQLDVPVHGYAYPWDSTANDWLDEDQDRLPTFVEEWIGTDPDDPDSDDDGIIDGLEDRNGNGIQDARETLALASDSDGDGLLDGEEDRNGNGGMDGDETSPLLRDTDTDVLSDYEESITHTDALDPQSFLAVESFTKESTNTVLHWMGRRGVHYQVQQSHDMKSWTMAPVGTGDEEQPDRIAARDEMQTYRYKADTHPLTGQRILVLD